MDQFPRSQQQSRGNRQPELLMSTAPRQTRRLRFSLRTLLLLVAACAVGTWIYLTGLPWLQQIRFERAVRQLKVGCTVYDAHSILPPTKGVTTTFSANA